METVELKGTRILRKLVGEIEKYRNIVLQGGARSSKTFSIAQYLVLKCLNEWAGARKIITVLRKTFPALRSSVMRDFFEILERLKIYNESNRNRTTHEYELNGNTIEFVSLDEPQKIRGRKRNIAWLNEANEFEYDDYLQISLRTSEKIFFDFNPSEEFHWIYERVIPRSDSFFIKSNYLDNPFLSESLKKEIEGLKEEDENLWRIYGLGERGQAQDLIFTNWDLISHFPENINHFRYGVDFGWNHPSVLLFVGVRERDVYIDEVIYQSHLTNSDFIDLMLAENVSKSILMRCDSAEPDRIAEIIQAGFLAEGAKKGADSIKDGIDNIKRCKLHITRRSVNTIKEIRNYKWKRDKKTGHLSDEPVKFKDDAMAALRYAIGDLVIDSDLFKPKQEKKVVYTPTELFWNRVKKDKEKFASQKGEFTNIEEEEYVSL